MEGGLFHEMHMECQQQGGCKVLASTQTPRGVFTAKSWERKAPHCQACKEMMMEGSMPWPPEPEPVAARVGHSDGAFSPNALVGSGGSCSSGATVGGLCKQAICACCNDVHDLTSAVDGRAVSGYLFGPGMPEHMQLQPNGLYICEWCAKYQCGRCGTHSVDTQQPRLANWSKFRNCKHSCEPLHFGGWGSVRSQLRQKANNMALAHCRACRLKIIMGTQLDLSARTSGSGRVVQAVLCYCCKEVHEAAELGIDAIPGYLTMPDYEEHVKQLADGRHLCEWCTKWMCHKCGRAKWTDTGNNTWDDAQIRANAHDLERAHCKTCREKVIMGRTLTRPPKAMLDAARAQVHLPPAGPGKSPSTVAVLGSLIRGMSTAAGGAADGDGSGGGGEAKGDGPTKAGKGKGQAYKMLGKDNDDKCTVQ
ncbi:hypothetical protein FOA52_006900 [Chlamydomonas sp. UWO 241]|nr:hypothetical protein FOA52_006900 [Chlamydomonas sp. UWO 241]